MPLRKFAGLLGALAALGFIMVSAPAMAEAPSGSTVTRVTTRSGMIEGASPVGGVRSYLGIPYAAPPVGPLRWREPQPAAAWTDVRKATSYGPSCTQPSSPWEARDVEPPPQSEDCLYLNVWTPAANAGERLPVMVWFHGGGLMIGSGSEDRSVGANLARKGVVVVTVNYRLGPLGFLVLKDLNAESPHKTSGNYGLLDQIAALRWIRENVAAFGGNPQNVTIFGFSAGSTSVNALQASPLARGLFHRAIGESTANMNPGSGIWHLRTFAEAEDYGEKFKRLVGARTLAEMRALPARVLVDAPPKFWLVEGDGYVLPDEIHDIFASGRQTRIPVLAGATADEGTTLGTAKDLSWIHPRTPEDWATFGDLYGSGELTDVQVVNDVVLWQMREWVRLNAQTEKKSFFYFFSHKPPRPSPGRELGAYHGAEIPYVFRTLSAFDWPWTKGDEQLSEIVSSYWVNFARTGDPNGPGLPVWPAYSDDTAMALAPNAGAIAMPRQKALAVLDAYFERERKRPLQSE